MVKLLYWEYRKHFVKKSLLLALLFFSILNVLKIYSVYDQTSLLSKSTDPKWNDLYWEMYEDFGGTISNEKIEKLMSIYQPLANQTVDKTASTANDNPDTYTGNLYNDTYFFRWNFVNPMEYAYMYKEYANEVVTSARENLSFYESLGNQYEYKKNEQIVERYEGRYISEFSYTEMYKEYFHHDFSAFLVILLCLYVLISVFVSEKETEMDILLLTTVSGGLRTTWAKVITSMIFVCVVCTWFWLIDFAAFAAIYGSLEGTFSPVYAIETFVNAAITLNLGQYVIVSGIVKTIGILVISLFFLLVSTLLKNALLPYIISITTMFVLIYIQELYMGSSNILLKVINPFVLVMNRELFSKTEFLNLYDYPVISYIPAFVISIAWGAMCIVGILLLVRKNTVYQKG